MAAGRCHRESKPLLVSLSWVGQKGPPVTSQRAAAFFFHGSNKVGRPVTSQTEREPRLSHETSVYNNSVSRHYLHISSSSSGSDIFRAFNPHPYMLGRLFLKPKIKGPGIICIFQVTAVVQICFDPSTLIKSPYARRAFMKPKINTSGIICIY